jgi:predicted Zn-dependent protease
MGDICDESVTVRSAVDEVVLSAASVCVEVGYLCAELEALGSQRILRWPENTGRLRIRVSAPPGVAPEHARDLQSAAVRGIQYWQRRPFELVIDTHPIASEPADIEISWGEGLSGSQLGLTQVRWVLESGKIKFEVLGIALGLPHSDSERDVMYPTNTARNLSTRDFRTVDALYRLPNGAEIAGER